MDYAINPIKKNVENVLALRSSEHIGVSPLTNKGVQPRKDSAVCHNLLNCKYSPTLEDFSGLCH